MTVPPLGGGQDRAALAAGHVDTDDRDVGGAAGARRDRLAQRDRVPGVGDGDHVGERRPSRSRSASRSCGTTPIVRPRPAARRRPGTASPDFPRRRPTTATAGRSYVPAHHAGGQRGRATDVHHRQGQLGGQVVGEHRGDRAAEEDRRTRRPGTCSPRPSQRGQAVLDHQRGQRQRDQRGDPVADGAGRAATRGPTSSTVPTSMPPEPVTGFCILPRVGDDVEHRGADARRRRRRGLRSSWRKDAASRLSRSTRIRTSSGQSSRRVSRRSRRLGQHAGRASRTRCRPTGAGWTGTAVVLQTIIGQEILRRAIDRPEILRVSWHDRTRRPTRRARHRAKTGAR